MTAEKDFILISIMMKGFGLDWLALCGCNYWMFAQWRAQISHQLFQTRKNEMYLVHISKAYVHREIGFRLDSTY